MASESKETRLKQKATLEAKLQKRLALLAEKGLDEKEIARDVLVKELKANLKQTEVRLRTIAANVKRTADLAAMKAERLAKPKEETPKAKKAAPEPPPEAKPKKKKKKEGEPQQA
jgi:response regulator RpfG family c-di-GMP phosphodiesterase